MSDQMLYLEQIVRQCNTSEEALDCVDYVSRWRIPVGGEFLSAFKEAPFIAGVRSEDAHKFSSLYAKLLQLAQQDSGTWQPFVDCVSQKVYKRASGGGKG